MKPPQQIELPENLRAQMAEFRKRLWRIKFTEAILSGLIGFILSYLFLFISDRFWSTPTVLGIIILIGGSLLAFFFAPFWIHKWVWKKRNPSQLARLLTEKFPELGDRILGIVELGTPDKNQVLYSETLKKAAIQQVAEQAAHEDFFTALPKPRHKMAIALTVLLVALVSSLALLVPEASLNSLLRWINPAANIPRYTFTRLDNIPERIYVPSGEGFHLNVKMDPDSKRLVDTVQARTSSGLTQDAPMAQNDQGEHFAQFSFPGIFEDTTVHISAGDAYYDILVIPRLRPNIKDIHALVEYPDYIGLGQEEVPLKTGTLYVLKGASAQLKALSTSPLRSAFLLKEEQPPHPLEINSSTASFPALKVEESSEMEFTWEDEYGISSHPPFKIRIEAVEDASPEVYLQSSDREIFLLEKETVELDITALDDFGLMELGVEWTGQQLEEKRILLKGSHDTKRLDGKFIFQAESLGIKPQRLSLAAIAKDFKPGREYKKSSPLVIYVLTKNEHAQKIKADLEMLTNQLEELAQREQLLADETEHLKSLEESDLMSAETRQQLKDLARSEKENAEQLKKITEAMEGLFKKALRNDEIDKESMRPFMDAKETLEKIPDNSQKKAQNALSSAAEDNNTTDKTKNDLDSAEQHQKDTLESLNSALKKLQQSTKNMEAGTFSARLKKAAGEEREIVDVFTTMLPNAIGLAPFELLPKDRRSVRDASSLQKSVIRDLFWIADDLMHFFIRSENKVHKEIAESMSDVLIDNNLTNLPLNISKNHSSSVIDTGTLLYNLLNKWAEQIGATRSQQGDGGDGGGNEGGMSESDFDFMLKVMRMIQSQQDIRYRTRLLEEEKNPLSVERLAPNTTGEKKEDSAGK